MSAVVWVVASADAARRWTDALGAAGVDAVALAWSDLAPPPDVDAAVRALETTDADLVLMTSRYATAFLEPDAGRGLPAACVGEATATAARNWGFDVRHVGEAGGAELAQRVLSSSSALRKVLFLRGVDARHEAGDTLRAVGVKVEEAITYAMRPRQAFADEVRAAPPPRVVVAGSPRAVEALHKVVPSSEAHFVAMGGLTVLAVQEQLGAEASITDRTDTEGLVAAVRAHLEAAE